MTRLAFRSLASRPLRTVLTVLAILLGVAMITGTYVLTDQIDNGFKDIFQTSFKGTAVQVAPKSTFAATDGSGTTAQTLNDHMLAQVQAVPGVAKAAGTYQTLGAAIVGGKTISTGGAPTLLTTNPGEPFNQATLVAGREVQARDEVAIIKSFADQEDLKPGDTFDVAAPAGLQHVTVVGVFTWGDSGSMGGTIVVAGRLQDVQRWGGEPGKLSGIAVAAEPGVTPKELASKVRAALPATVSVKTGEQAAADASAETAASINTFLTPMLLAFAGISVFVGAFIIFNAFSITVAQRRREFAMLRALGASRRQVLGSVVAEALTLGVLASATGIVAGLGVAKAINLLFHTIGADIPTAGIALAPRTIVIAALVGVGVTLLSALAPALRATRVPPVAALQEGSTLPPTRFTKFTHGDRRRLRRPRRRLARHGHLQRRRGERSPAVHGPRRIPALHRHRHAEQVHRAAGSARHRLADAVAVAHQRPPGPRQRRPQPEPHGRYGCRPHDRPGHGRVHRGVRPGHEGLVQRRPREVHPRAARRPGPHAPSWACPRRSSAPSATSTASTPSPAPPTQTSRSPRAAS